MKIPKHLQEIGFTEENIEAENNLCDADEVLTEEHLQSPDFAAIARHQHRRRAEAEAAAREAAAKPPAPDQQKQP